MSTSKLKISKEYSDKLLEYQGAYSFVNLASIKRVLKLGDSDITYFCDGILMSLLISLFSLKKIKRVSFDFTSIARHVFSYCEANNLKIIIIGATELESLAFYNKIKRKYPNLNISARNGYFKQDERNDLIHNIIQAKYNVVVVGLGAGIQDEFLKDLLLAGHIGTSFSCGGFVRQESTKEVDYYPKWVNVMYLRAFYRMYREPHTIQRYLIDYPLNLAHLVLKKMSGKLSINVIENS